MSNIDNVVVSCLLHDIGKVINRTDNNTLIKHSILGARFLEQFSISDDILDGVKYHHKDEMQKAKICSDIAYIVYEADNISSAIDRKVVSEDKGFNKGLLLNSIFDYKNTAKNYKNGLFVNDENNIVIPIEDNKTDINEYNKISSQFAKAITEVLKTDNINIGYLLAVLEKYLINVPSTTEVNKNQDISLFDHLKVTATIGSCMYKYFEANDMKYSSEYYVTKRDEQMYKLLCGDLSGIQNFIYNIKPKSALKALKGRSFYLEVLVENIIDEILDELYLSRANLLYSGGGKFYLLLPNILESENTIKKAKSKINKWLVEKFGLDIYLAFSSLNCTARDLMTKSSDLFEKLSWHVSNEKLKRYQNDNMLNYLFSTKFEDDFISDRECSNCKKSNGALILDSESNTFICTTCSSIVDFGKWLSTSSNNEIIEISKTKKDGYIELPSIDGDILYGNFTNKESSDKIRIYAINSINKNQRTNLDVATFSGDKELKDFAKNGQGIDRIGVLRLDVDNLGNLFVKHFDKEYKTITRYTALSRNISLFFKEYIYLLAKDNYKINGKEYQKSSSLETFLFDSANNKYGNISIVYSGGDDLFVLGAWDEVINFTINLNLLFRKFVSNKLTLSAGIGIYKNNYPISKIALEVGELEETAKGNIDKNNNQKNSICLFTKEYTYSFDELEDVVELYNKIYCVCDFNSDKTDKVFLSKSMMYKFLLLLENDEINYARFCYTIARMKTKETKINHEKFSKAIIGCFIDEYNKKLLKTVITIFVYQLREN